MTGPTEVGPTHHPGRVRTFWNPYYHAFNLFEGVARVVLSALVLARYLRRGRSILEVWYALSFFTFGLTDSREAHALGSWLVWVELANLVVLARLRAT